MVNDSYKPFDALVFKDKGKPTEVRMIVEAKVRGFKSDKYKGGLLLEKKKRDAILNELKEFRARGKNKTYKAYYLVCCDDKDMLFNLESDFGSIIYMNCPKATASNGNNEMIKKECYMIDLSKSVKTIKNEY